MCYLFIIYLEKIVNLSLLLQSMPNFIFVLQSRLDFNSFLETALCGRCHSAAVIPLYERLSLNWGLTLDPPLCHAINFIPIPLHNGRVITCAHSL